MVEFLSGRVKKTPSSEVSEDRYSYLKLEEAEPDLGVPSSNNAILISNSTGNRDWLFVSDGLSISVSNTGVYSLSHDNTSDVANLVFSSRTYVTELSFDQFGHVLSYSTGTETVVDTDTFVVSASFNTSDGILTLTRNDANTVTVDLDGRYLSESGPGSGLDADLLDGEEGTYYLDWSNFTNTPDATITVSGTSGLTGSGSFAVDDFANTSISLSHDNTSDVANLSATSRTYVTGLTFDEFGHVVSYTTDTETVVDTDTFVVSASFNTSDGILTLTRNDANTVTVDLDGRYLSESGPGSGLDADLLDGEEGVYYLDWSNFTNTPDATITVSGTSGLTGSGSFAVDDFANTTISLSHDNTSDVANLSATSRTYVTGLTFDEFGHVVSYTTDTETVTDTDTFVNSASFNTSDGILTLTRNDANTVTVDLDGRYLTSESDDLDSVTTRGSTTTNNITVGDLTADNVTFQGNLQIDGTLTVSGNVVTINATELSVDDNMIYLNANANFTNPDLGVVGAYNDGTYAHAGIFRDATDGRWKVFDGYTPEPDDSIYINTAHPTFSLADFQAETIYGDLVGNATTATTLETSRTVSLTGDASGSFDFDGSANVSFSVTVNDSDQLDGQDGNYYLDWANFTNTPDATITVSGSNGLTGTGSFAVDDFANTTISLSHDNTSDVANLVASSRTYVTGLAFDEFGHVVSYTTDTETVTDTDTFVNSASFNTSDGILTLTRNDANTVTVDLDGRYLSESGPGSGLDADLLDGEEGTYYLDWTNFTNTPDATITVSGTSGLTGTGSFAVDDFANTSISLSHDNTSDVANLVATSRTYVTGLTFDEFGHVVSYTTDTETVTDTDTFVNALSFDANTGILTVTRNDTVSLNVDLDTRYLSASGPGSGLDADTLDGQQGTYYLDYNNFTNVPIIGDGTIIVNTGSGLTGSGTFSVNDESNTTFTLSHDNTSDVANIETSTGVYVNGITFDEFGHVVSYTTEAAASASDTYVISGSYDANTSTLSLTRNDSNTVNISFGDVVQKTGTPANNQIAVWVNNGTIEGDSNLTWNGSIFDINGSVSISEGIYDSANTLGTNGQVLTSNGSSVIWSNVSSGLTLLAVETVTASVNAIDFDLPTGFSAFRLILNNVSGNNGSPIIRFSTDGGSTFISTSTHNSYSLTTDIGGTSASLTNADNDTGLSYLSGINSDISGVIDVIISADQASITGMGTGSIFSDFFRFLTYGQVATTTRADAMRLTFYSGAALYTGGTAALYGYREAL